MLARFLFPLLMLLATASSAVVVDDLYSISLPMASNQDMSAQSAAITEACQEVLLKVSGNSAVFANPSIQSACQQADGYVQQYSYSANSADNAGQLPYLLKVNFSSDAINHVLSRANVPIWGRERPVTLFWVAEDANNQQQILSAGSDDAIVNAIDGNADRRGLPVLFPVMDLTDTQQVSFNDVMAPFVNTVLQASTRYGSNAIVMAHFVQNNNAWQSQWTLSLDSKVTNWSFNGADLSTVVQQGVDAIADTVASQFVQKNVASQRAVDIQIDGISTFEDFAKAQHYLAHLNGVQRVNVNSVSNSQVIYTLTLSSTITSLQQAIALDSLLTSTDASNAPTTILLHYRWTA